VARQVIGELSPELVSYGVAACAIWMQQVQSIELGPSFHCDLQLQSCQSDLADVSKQPMSRRMPCENLSCVLSD
jgi:hypothetical protein